MRVDLHPEARAEVRSGALWYEERREGLGAFVAAIDATFAEDWQGAKIVSSLGRHRKGIHSDSQSGRRTFSIRYRVRGHKRRAVVLAVAHQKRRPLYWLTRAGQQTG